MSSGWTNSPEAIKDFHRNLYGKLCYHNVIDLNRNITMTPWVSPDYMGIWEVFKAQHPNFDRYDTYEQCADAVVQWTLRQRTAPLPTDGVSHITVKVTRHYGELSVEFGTTEAVALVRPEDRGTAWFRLLSDVEQMHDNIQHEMHLVARPASTPVSVTPTETTVQGTTLLKESVDGQDRIKIRAGDWQKYGVPVYEEFYNVLGIDPDALDYGEHPYPYRVVVMLDARGEPKKVVSRVTME